MSCSRCERPICTDDMFPAAVGLHCPICAGKMRDEGSLAQAEYRVRARAERNPLLRMLGGAQMTSLLVGANVAVFVLMTLTGAPTSGRTLVRFGALVTPLPASQWWRLITAMFVHIGALHILFNMFALIIFGGTIERRYGKARFLTLYLASGVLGSATSLAFSHGPGIAAGASGAIFGIFGAWISLVIRHHSMPGMAGQLRSLLFLVGINFVLGVLDHSIDLRAHVGGLIGGFVIGGALEASALVKGGARVAVASAGYVLVGVAAYLLVSAHVV